jgi:hypothetical protein
MCSAPSVREADCCAPASPVISAPVLTPGTSSYSPTYRQDESTSTASFYKGGDLQYHLHPPPLWHVFFMLGTPVLCFLNGCAYYLFWRSRYLEESATLRPTALTTAPVSAAGSTTSTLFMSSDSSAAPSAYYGVVAGFAFAFILTQWVVQASACAFIRAQMQRKRAIGFYQCGLLFEVAFLPLTIAQMMLIGRDYHLHKDTVGALRLWLGGDADTEWAAVRVVASPFPTVSSPSSSSQRYVVLWIVSFTLTTTSMVVVASAMWTDLAVSWIQRRVFAAFLDDKRRRGKKVKQTLM